MDSFGNLAALLDAVAQGHAPEREIVGGLGPAHYAADDDDDPPDTRGRVIPLSTVSKQDWRTPHWLFERLLLRWRFTLDAAADERNALCDQWYDGQLFGDGLKEPWHPFTFCNPPYKKIRPWVDKAAYEADERGTTSVLLLPARLETKWYVDYHRFCETEILTPRLAFEGGDGKAPPHGSMLLIFSPYSVSNPSPRNQPRVRLVTYKKG